MENRGSVLHSWRGKKKRNRENKVTSWPIVNRSTPPFDTNEFQKCNFCTDPTKTIQTELGMNASISKGLICRSDANRGSNTNQAHPLIDEQASRAPEPPRSSSHRIPTPSSLKHFGGNPIQLIRQLMRLASVSGEHVLRTVKKKRKSSRKNQAPAMGIAHGRGPAN